MSDWNNQEGQEPTIVRREGRNRVERARFMARFTAILLILMVLSFLSLIPIYLEMRSAPVVLDLGITILAVIGLGAAHLSAVRQQIERSGYAVLFVALLMVLGIGVEQGAVLVSAVPVLVGVFLVVSTVWPGKWLRWIFFVITFAALFFGISQITLPITYNLAEAESVGIRNGMIVTGALIMLLSAVIRSVQRGSIRARLLISYSLLALIPVILISVAIDIVYVQRAREQIFAQLQSVATLKEEQISTWVEQLQGTLAIAIDEDELIDFLEVISRTTIEETEGVEPLDEQEVLERIRERFATVIEQTNLYEEIFVLNLDGHVLVSTDEEQIGKIQSSQTYFREGVESPFFQPPVFFPSSGTVSMIVARPLTGANGETIGVIAGRVSLDTLNEIMLQRTGLGSTGETYLVGLNSALITESRFIQSDTTIFVRTEGALASVSRQESSQGLYDDYRGVPVVGVYRWLPDVQMALLSEQDQSEAFSVIQFTIIASIVFVVVTALIAVIVALYISRSIATPVVTLAQVAQDVSRGNLEQDIDLERDDEIGLLAEAFNSMTAQLRQLIGGLEQRVAEQTRDLTLAAEVGQRIASERNLQTLLAAAVDLIKERFNLYHAQLYLVDSKENALVLQAGTGQAGQELVRRGHRLTIGSGSINGTVAAEHRPVIVADTQESRTFRPNPLLPATRSEMSVPLLIGERIVGVLDLQSSAPNALSSENLPAFQALAGQLAVAIDNAALFTEAEQSRLALEEQTRRLTRTNWTEYLDAISRAEHMRYEYHAEAAPATSHQEIEPSLRMKVPIQITNEPIGFIELDNVASNIWSTDKMNLVQEVATRVAQQVENLRLFAEAEQYRLQAEQAVRRLTREGWESYQQNSENQGDGFIYTQDRVIPAATQKGLIPQEPTHAHPLLIRGEPIGELGLLGTEGIDNETAALLATVAETLTTHIENLRLTEATEAALSQTERLYDLTTQLTKTQTLEEVLQVICLLRPGTRASLLTIEADAQGSPEWLTISASWPPGATGAPTGMRFAVNDFPISNLWLKQPERASLIGNTELDPRMDARTQMVNRQYGVQGAVYLPLRVGNVWVGLVTLSWDIPQNFTELDQQLYDSVTAQSAVVINNRLLFQATAKRAEREARINTINQRIQGTASVETALEAATREIGKLLKARRVAVEIGTTPQSNGS